MRATGMSFLGNLLSPLRNGIPRVEGSFPCLPAEAMNKELPFPASSFSQSDRMVSLSI